MRYRYRGTTYAIAVRQTLAGAGEKIPATNVTVDGTVNGDLLAFGRNVTVNGKVTGNVISAGGSVAVNGEVGHDVVAAGGVVTLGPGAQIAHSAYTAGGSVESQAGSLVGGSLLIGAGQGLVSGQVTNDLLAGAGRLRLESAVGGDAKINVDSSGSDSSTAFLTGLNAATAPNVPPGLTFGPEADVAGTLEYVSPTAVEAANGVASEVVHTLPVQDQQLSQELAQPLAQPQTTSSYLFDALRRLVALLLVGLLIAWLAPRWITAPAERLLSQPWPSLGIGLAALVAAPITWLVAFGLLILIAVVFALLSLGALTGMTLLAGLPVLGLVFVAVLFAVSYLCQAIIAYVAGRWILSRTRPEWNKRIYAPLLIGLFGLGLLFALPVAGGILEFLVVLAGLGAIILAVLQRRPAPQAPAEAPTALQASS
jgi:hypothetical protein